jgi:nucleoside-diphosphate-sugar epimerase
MKKILIANTSGFLGNSLKLYLKMKNYRVFNFKNKNIKKSYECLICSNFFISKKKNTYQKKNLIFAKKIINFLKKTKMDVIFISSHLPINVNKNIKKLNEYQLAKYNIENMLLEEGKIHNFYVKILRFSNIYSTTSKYGIIPDLLRKMKSDRKILVRNSNHFRDFIHIKDVVKIIEKFIKIKSNIRLYAGTGIKTQIKKLCLLLSKIKDKNIQFNFLKDKTNLNNQKLSFSNNALKKKIPNIKFFTIEKGLQNL